MKKKLLAIVLATACCVCMTACGTKTDTDTVTPVESQVESAVEESVSQAESVVTVQESVEESKEEIVLPTWEDLMHDNAIMSTGNNARLKRVLDKARAGETVNIATLGGSVTEGAGATTNKQGYAYQFAERFAETYGTGDNINFVNAGLSGTPSALGVMRYQKDVVDALGAAPDLLIIEFAVNDWNEATGGRAYESLIYRALTDNEDCAVILLFASTSQYWNLQSDFFPVGSYYKVPMVSVKKAIENNNNIKVSEFFSDEYHPKTYGHTIMSDLLMYLLEKVDGMEAKEDVAIPEEPKKGREFANMILAIEDSSDVKIDKGSFGATDTAVQTCYFTGDICFPDNYMHEADAGNAALKFTINCSKVLLDYKTANDKSFGAADIYVDGKCVTTVDGYLTSGWNNNSVILIVDETECAEHVIEVRMAAGSEDKKFTVLSLAYSQD